MIITDLVMGFLNFIEKVLIVWFIVRMFGFQKISRWNWAASTVLCIVLFLLNEAALQQQLGDMVITSIHFGVLVLFSAVFLKGKIWLKCFWSGIAVFLVPVIYVCFMQSILLIGGFSYTEFVDKQNIYYIIASFMSRILYFLSTSGILYVARKETLVFSRGHGIVWICIFLYSLLMESFLMRLMRLGHMQSAFEIWVVSFGIFLFDGYFLVTIHNIGEKKEKEEQLRVMEQQMIYQKKYMMQMQKSEQQIRRMRHDYKNHIQNIQILLEKEKYTEAVNYIQETGTYYLKNNGEILDTENEIINAVINTRIAICREENIPFYCTCSKLGNLQEVEGFKTATVLFNLLDNAIEASREEENPEIFLEMRQREKELFCSIKNRITESVLQKNPKLKTSKKEKQKHGIGISHVQELVEEMHGILLIEEKEGFFCVECVLELEQKKEDV